MAKKKSSFKPKQDHSEIMAAKAEAAAAPAPAAVATPSTMPAPSAAERKAAATAAAEAKKAAAAEAAAAKKAAAEEAKKAKAGAAAVKKAEAKQNAAIKKEEAKQVATLKATQTLETKLLKDERARVLKETPKEQRKAVSAQWAQTLKAEAASNKQELGALSQMVAAPGFQKAAPEQLKTTYAAHDGAVVGPRLDAAIDMHTKLGASPVQGGRRKGRTGIALTTLDQAIQKKATTGSYGTGPLGKTLDYRAGWGDSTALTKDQLLYNGKDRLKEVKGQPGIFEMKIGDTGGSKRNYTTQYFQQNQDGTFKPLVMDQMYLKQKKSSGLGALGSLLGAATLLIPGMQAFSPLIQGAIAGAVGGGLSSGSLEGALKGGLLGGVGGGLTNYMNTGTLMGSAAPGAVTPIGALSKLTGIDNALALKSITSGITGGLTSGLSGGDALTGMLSGGLGTAASGLVGDLNIGGQNSLIDKAATGAAGSAARQLVNTGDIDMDRLLYGAGTQMAGGALNNLINGNPIGLTTGNVAALDSGNTEANTVMGMPDGVDAFQYDANGNMIMEGKNAADQAAIDAASNNGAGWDPGSILDTFGGMNPDGTMNLGTDRSLFNDPNTPIQQAVTGPIAPPKAPTDYTGALTSLIQQAAPFTPDAPSAGGGTSTGTSTTPPTTGTGTTPPPTTGTGTTPQQSFWDQWQAYLASQQPTTQPAQPALPEWQIQAADTSLGKTGQRGWQDYLAASTRG